MTLYRKKMPLVVEAVRWGSYRGRLREVVRYYRHPEVPGFHACKTCGFIMHDHGWIDAPNGGHIVCPGDWIVSGVDNAGEYVPCSPRLFEATYEPFDVSEDAKREKA